MAVQSPGHTPPAFLSYTQEMEPQAAVLRKAMESHGITVVSAEPSRPDAAWRTEVAELVAHADLFVVLVPLQGLEGRPQQYEISQILEAAWRNSGVRVAVVAPAVGAIPLALRHQPFLVYFAYDEVKLRSWTSNTSDVEHFLEVLLDPSQHQQSAQQETPADEVVRQWRNRVVHLGRAGIPDDEREDMLARLRDDFDRALDSGRGFDSERLVDRILLAEALDDRALANSFRKLLESAHPNAASSPNESADTAYARALAALEVGDLSDALAGFTNATELNARLRGQTDPRTVASRYNAGVSAARMGDLPTARVLYEGALDSARQGLGDNHPQTAAIAVNLAQVYSETGDTDEALQLLRLAENAYTLVTPHNSPEITAVVDELHRLGA